MSTLILARFVIETTSPLAINSGDREFLASEEVAKDWNGLPYIPATSIVGVWRKILRSLNQDGFISELELFGTTSNRDLEGFSNGKASSIYVTNGLLLNDKSKVSLSEKSDCGSLLSKDVIQGDNLYKIFSALNPFTRTRNKINNKGVAEDKKLFTCSYCPVGTRFMFDVHVSIDEQSTEKLEQIQRALSYFYNEDFSLGKYRTNGNGRFKVIASKYQEVDLADINKKPWEIIEKALSYKNIPQSSCNEVKKFISADPQNIYLPIAEFSLKGIDSWRIGNGTSSSMPNDIKAADFFIYQEKFLKWNGDTFFGDAQKVVVCGSMIKGIIAHRTSYYYRYLNLLRNPELKADFNYCADNFDGELPEEKNNAKLNKGILGDLFGYTDETNPDDSKCGLVILEDCEIVRPKIIQRFHNKIDQFTGGVRKGALFCEELLVEPEFTFKVKVDKDKFDSLKPEFKEALYYTLQDIQHGYLAIASGTSRAAHALKCMNSNPIVEEFFIEK